MAAAVGQNKQEVLAVVSRKSRKPREWPPCSRSSASLAAKSIQSFPYTPGQVHSKYLSSVLDPADLAVIPPVVVRENQPVLDQDVRESLVPVAKT